MSKTDRTHIRHNLSFDMQDDQQRIAHEYLLKLDRGQSKKIAELICNMLSQNGIKNVATLSAEKAEKLSTLFFKLDDEKQKEAYEYLSILGERQFEKIADLVAELLSRNGVNDMGDFNKAGDIGMDILNNAEINLYLAMKPQDITETQKLMSLSRETVADLEKLEKRHGLLVTRKDKLFMNIKATDMECEVMSTDINDRIEKEASVAANAS